MEAGDSDARAAAEERKACANADLLACSRKFNDLMAEQRREFQGPSG